MDPNPSADQPFEAGNEEAPQEAPSPFDSPTLNAPDITYQGEFIKFGLVTYQWAKDWSLSDILANCEKAGALGVELRTTHAHGVEPEMSAADRSEVAGRFANSPVTCVGLGSNERFDSPDPAAVRAAVERTKEFIRLSHDIGGSGVKVKPDSFHEGIPREKTIAQIAGALNELGDHAAGFGQQIRLEVHGDCRHLPTIAEIMRAADHPLVAVCWNSNAADLEGDGLAKNFQLVAGRLGATLHVRELDDPNYPYAELFDLLVAHDYDGWVLLEASSEQQDLVAALARQRELFDRMLLASRRRITAKE